MFLRKLVSLTTLSIIAPVLTRENKDVILQQIAGKSPADVEWVFARYNPTPLRRSWDKIVPMVVRRINETREPSNPKDNNLVENRGPAGPQLISQESSPSQLSLEERYRFEFSGSKAFKEKLDKIRALASGRLAPGTSLEATLELLMDEYITRHSPEKREARRKAREEKNKRLPKADGSKRATRSRYIKRRTRDKVFLRDGFRCTYVSLDGVRCNAATGLHIDHIVPSGIGGTSSPGNLRVLCGAHNRLAAEQVYGKELMSHFY